MSRQTKARAGEQPATGFGNYVRTHILAFPPQAGNVVRRLLAHPNADTQLDEQAANMAAPEVAGLWTAEARYRRDLARWVQCELARCAA
jgi:hypothetical protein